MIVVKSVSVHRRREVDALSGLMETLRAWLLGTLYLLPGLVIGFTVHECCHALAAVKLGDATPAREGRLTLNPSAHIDPMGLLMFVLLGWGYARPVRVRPGNLRLRKWGEAVVSLAGPFSNLLLAVLFYALWQLLPYGLWSDFLFYGCTTNVTLFALNLLPVAPLDGFTVLRLLLPVKAMNFVFWMQRYGIYVLLVLSIFNVLDMYLGVAQTFALLLFGTIMGF